MSHTPKTPTPSYTTANLPTDLPVGSVVFDSDQQKLVSFKDGSWNTIGGGVGSTTYVRDNVAGVIDQVGGDIPNEWKNGDASIKGLVIGTSCKVIGDSAFNTCLNDVGNLVIPDNVQTIGASAFAFCTDLTSIRLGDGITEIKTSAFSFTTSLTKFYINSPSSVFTGASAFQSTNSAVTLYVTADYFSSYNASWRSSQSFPVGGNITTWSNYPNLH